MSLSCSLTSTCELWYLSVSTHIHRHLHLVTKSQLIVSKPGLVAYAHKSQLLKRLKHEDGLKLLWGSQSNRVSLHFLNIKVRYNGAHLQSQHLV